MLKKRQVEWRDLLEAYSRHLDLVADALEGKGVWPGSFEMESPKVDMPSSLKALAEELMERTAKLSDLLKEKMAICRSVLDQSKEQAPNGRVVLLDVMA